MRKALLLVAVLGFTSTGYTKGPIKELADEVSTLVNQSVQDLENSDKREIRKSLTNIVAIFAEAGIEIDGSVSTDGFSCVARDNDNAQPWMIGAEDEDTLQVTKISGSVLGSKENCNKSLDAAIPVRSSLVFCGSRDNDGVAPFVLMGYSPGKGVLMSKAIAGRSFDDCVATANVAKKIRHRVKFCTTRDNDGAAPYVHSQFNSKTHEFINGDQVFGNVEDCQNNL